MIDISSLLSLQDGWYDGHGLAPPSNGLHWLSAAWAEQLPLGCTLLVCPTYEGRVLVEWTINRVDISVEIDVVTKRGYLLGVNLDDGDITFEEEIDLTVDAGWKCIADHMILWNVS